VVWLADTHVGHQAAIVNPDLSIAYLTPSWCAMNFYGQRATKSQANQDFGLLLFEIVKGTVTQVWPLVTFVDLRTTETWL